MNLSPQEIEAGILEYYSDDKYRNYDNDHIRDAERYGIGILGHSVWDFFAFDEFEFQRLKPRYQWIHKT